MKRITASMILLSLFFLLAACGNNSGANNTEQTNVSTAPTVETWPEPVVKDTDNLDRDALTALLEKLRTENNIAGMAVAVTDGESMIYSQGFGYDDVNSPDIPTDAYSIFRIASVSKTYTAILIMRLCEEGVLDLDTPIKTYLPWLTLSKPGAADTITLRQLLTHTAGFPGDDVMGPGPEDDSTANDVIQKTLPLLTISIFEGEYRYSTWGYNVIGCVASTVTGKPFSQLIKEYVTDPLGMHVTTFDHKFVADTQYPLSQPHVRSGNSHRVDRLLINAAFNAGAGLYSNTDDMCKLARFFLNGGVTDSGERLLSEESFQAMTSSQVKASDASAYGFGVSIWSIDGHNYYGHNGTYYGQNYRCSFYVDAETGYSVITLMNSYSTGIDLRREVPMLIFDMLRGEN